MTDNSKSATGRKRQKMSGNQDWDISQVREKFDVSSQQVAGAIRAVGNNRQNVEEYIRTKLSHKRVI
jgi:hypothetical protein